MWNELIRNTGNRRCRNLSIYILKHIRNVYCDLHHGTSAAPTAFSSTTCNRDSVLLFPQSYPLCTIACHHPAEKYPESVPSALKDLTPVAMHASTPWTMPVGSEGHRLLSILPFRETFGVINVPRPPSYLLRRICDRRTETGSSILDATPSVSSVITLHRSEVLGTSSPLVTHDASLVPISNTDHIGTASADTQSIDSGPYYISQQCTSVAPPARAALRGSPIKDSRGFLVNITHGTTGTTRDEPLGT
ncbi:hypothetical protein EDB83DRAFT_2480093 [Lactarius deliciosus]|nr:hypothetical protein EDB83DRAFT_2480093 [Lactarius deliciosus]